LYYKKLLKEIIEWKITKDFLFFLEFFDQVRFINRGFERSNSNYIKIQNNDIKYLQDKEIRIIFF